MKNFGFWILDFGLNPIEESDGRFDRFSFFSTTKVRGIYHEDKRFWLIRSAIRSLAERERGFCSNSSACGIMGFLVSTCNIGDERRAFFTRRSSKL